MTIDGSAPARRVGPEWLLWVAFAVAGIVWMVFEYKSTGWYRADEWPVISRSLGSRLSFSGALRGDNGHLVLGSYVTYALQVRLFGLENSYFVYGVFIASLASLQLSAAFLMRRLGAPTLIALLAATVVAFFGASGQNVVWQFMLGANFALAASIAAAALTVSFRNPSTRVAVSVSALLFIGLAMDSGVAIFGVFLVAILLFALWPMRIAVSALAPPLLALGAWLTLADVNASETFTRPFTEMASGAFHLLALSAGGLAGAGDTNDTVRFTLDLDAARSGAPVAGENVGVVVLVVAAVIVVVGIARGALSRAVAANLVGSLGASALVIGGFALTRVFLYPTPASIAGSRYVGWVALFLMLALVPAIVATARSVLTSDRARSWALTAACGALALVFALNLSQLRPTQTFEYHWGENVEADTRQTLGILVRGCSNGRRPDPHANPSARFISQVPVSLIEELLAAGALSRDFVEPATPELERTVCGSA